MFSKNQCHSSICIFLAKFTTFSQYVIIFLIINTLLKITVCTRVILFGCLKPVSEIKTNQFQNSFDSVRKTSSNYFLNFKTCFFSLAHLWHLYVRKPNEGKVHSRATLTQNNALCRFRVQSLT